MVILNRDETSQLAYMLRSRPLVRGGGRNVGSRVRILSPISEPTLRAGPVVSFSAAIAPLSISRIPATGAFGAPIVFSEAPSLADRTGTVSITEVPSEGEPDLAVINPARYSIQELCRIILSSEQSIGLNRMMGMLTRFSLNIYGFPPCPEEDLMIAVFFFFEEKLNAKFKMVKCVKYQVQRHHQEIQEQVGVVFDKIQIADCVLRRAELALKGSGIEVKRNKNPELILLTTEPAGMFPTGRLSA